MTMSKGCVLLAAWLAVAVAPLGCGGDSDTPAKAPSAKTTAKTAELPKAVTTPKAQDKADAKAPEKVAKKPDKPPREEIVPAIARRRPQPVLGDKLPDDFPSDVPVYPESVPTASMMSRGDDMAVSFKTADTPAEVLDYYQTALGNREWRIGSVDQMETSGIVRATKDGRLATVLIMAGPGGTHITVTIAKE